MRVLLSTTAGAGHFRPLLPIAHALQRAGHEVACAAPNGAAEMVGRAGLRHCPLGDVPGDHPDRLAVLAGVPAMSPEEARFTFGSVIFGRLNTTYALPGARAAVAGFDPHLVVHESAELAVAMAAEAAGTPHVAVSPTLTVPEFVTALASGVADLRSGLGLDADRDGARALRAPVLSAFPASFDRPESASRDVHRFRAAEGPPVRESAGELVYVTLGSEAHSLPFFAEVLRDVVGGAVAAGRPVVVSTGADLPDDVLAGVGGDLRVQRWVDQDEVLARARVIVCHGGSGSTLAALAAAVPLVVVPLFADQPDNADRVVATGCGQRVDPGPGLAQRVSSAVEQLSEQPPPGSQAIALEMAALPSADDMVERLERWATGG